MRDADDAPNSSLVRDETTVSGISGAKMTPKEPPPEKQEDIRLRRWVVFSFWAVILFLGLPVWWHTTSIYRAKLPLDEMMDWADGRVDFQSRTEELQGMVY